LDGAKEESVETREGWRQARRTAGCRGESYSNMVELMT
jgi:hypothetical protein